MAAVVTAEFFFKPELIDDALTLLAEVLPNTRGFEGCEKLETVIDFDDPGHVMVVERWTSRDAHVAYLAWRVYSGSARRRRSISWCRWRGTRTFGWQIPARWT